MLKWIIFAALLLISTSCFTQYTLRLIVNKVATKSLEDIYVAGSFNNWNPKDEKYKLKPFGTSRRAIVIADLPAGQYEFKFTRGNWDKVQTTAKGATIENNMATLQADLTREYDIDGWSDNFPDKPKPNTATPQVKIIDTAFPIPQLNRTRRVWMYVPRSYVSTKKAYPVLYMQDGQNLFNEQTAPFGEWGIDEALDTLMRRYNKEIIVVGIDNGGEKRMTEYNPYDNPKFGKGEGNLYIDFLANTLKPYIDQHYRTLKDPQHTFIAGSSMGGLISLYAVVKYPHVFGGAGVISPALWTAPAIYKDVENATWSEKVAPKFFFYGGGQEGESMVPDMDKVIGIIEKKGSFQLRRVMSPLGKHNEPTWRKEFPEFFAFITRQ